MMSLLLLLLPPSDVSVSVIVRFGLTVYMVNVIGLGGAECECAMFFTLIYMLCAIKFKCLVDGIFYFFVALSPSSSPSLQLNRC